MRRLIIFSLVAIAVIFLWQYTGVTLVDDVDTEQMRHAIFNEYPEFSRVDIDVRTDIFVKDNDEDDNEIHIRISSPEHYYNSQKRKMEYSIERLARSYIHDHKTGWKIYITIDDYNDM